jgi:hypothetical protein
LMRFRPTFSLMSGANDLSQDMIQGHFNQVVTNRMPSFDIDLDNRFDKWAGLAWNDPISMGIDGVGVFTGRIDESDSGIEKKQGRVLNLKGRGNAGALEDIQTSMHIVHMSAHDIVEKIINTYNAMKWAADPFIAVASNLAPDDVYFTFLWRRRNFWQNLKDVSDALSAPPELGGNDTFYDYYVDPTNGFYFEPVGYRSSGVSIPLGLETMKRDYYVDSLPVKNDVWVFADPSQGTIPLTMQIGYNGGAGDDRTDPWTEDNPQDFSLYNIDIATTDPDCVIGQKSIKFITLVIMATDRFYWDLRFPYANAVWPWAAQEPGGGLNTYNEEQLREEMGEWNAVGFFIKTDTPFSMCMEVVDGKPDPCYACSESVRLDQGSGGLAWLFPEWHYVQLPFGPSANYKPSEWAQGSKKDQTYIDWSNIAEIRWVGYNYPYGIGTIQILFDGLRFIKPLVVNQREAGAGTRRIHFADMTNISQYGDIRQPPYLSPYKLAKIYARSILENLVDPNRYYDFENLGRTDIPVGYLFSLESRELVMREESYIFSKDEGWKITGQGYYHPGKRRPQTRPVLGHTMANVLYRLDEIDRNRVAQAGAGGVGSQK